MPASSGHHHRPPRARKVRGTDIPFTTEAHIYQQFYGWAGCSCGAWTRTGTPTTTTIEHRQHVAEIRRQAKERQAKLAAMTVQERLRFFQEERRQRSRGRK